MTALTERLAARIRLEGPLSVAQFMAAALYDPKDGYYATRPAIGADGDFLTAPEASQMFGEMIGLWCVQSWMELGRPDPLRLIELGPGRGTLMADVARAARVAPDFRAAADLTLVEVSPPLKAVQAQTLRAVGAAPAWVARLEDAAPGPSLLIANEFLDCLPIRQFVRTAAGWRERLIGLDPNDHTRLAFGLGPALPNDAMITAPLQAAPEGALAEVCPGLPALVDRIAERLNAAPGRALVIDYGAPRSSPGDTLQALRRHQKVPVLETAGEADLTAHVDFGELRRLARASGLDVAGPIGQGDWLENLGIGLRAQALAQANPVRAESLRAQLKRLIDPAEMGTLFQVICLSSRGLPAPAGFAPCPPRS